MSYPKIRTFSKEYSCYGFLARTLFKFALFIPDRFQTQVVYLVGVLEQSLLRQVDCLSFAHVAFLDEF